MIRPTSEPSHQQCADLIAPNSTRRPGQVPSIARVFCQILETPNAGKLMRGLDELLGGASHAAITGSVALALHQANLGSRNVRRPADLDLVVNQSAMEKLRQADACTLASRGFVRAPASREQLLWSDGGRRIRVNAVEASVSAAGRGLESVAHVYDVRVVPLDILISNLEMRAKSEPLNDRVKGDLAAIYATLRDRDQLNWNYPLRP